MNKIALFLPLAFAFLLSSGCAIFQKNDVKEWPTEADNIGLRVGEVAPNIDLDDPEGFNRQLKDMRGKVVLVDFWASWCAPCRAENPMIVHAYRQFKDVQFKNGSGFEVFSVSLDKTKDRWVNAIEKDGLAWPNHVSDLDGMNSYVVLLYELSSIPSSWLIDGDGVILAVNPEPRDLTDILNNYER